MTRIWYVIASLAVLVAVAIAVRGRAEQPDSIVASPTPTADVQTPTPTPTHKPVVKARPSVKPPTPTYAEVAQQYTGRRIQFDAYCAVTPAENTFLVGTDVLLDNRSPDDRIVRVGDTEYVLPGYGWKVVTMTAAELPATIAIDCGTAKNVGKIVIEALTTPTLSPEPSVTASVSPDFSPSASASASPSLEPSPSESASPTP